MMQAEANLRYLTKPLACIWLIAGLLGLGLVVFGLAVSDPIEPEDWLIAGILFAIFVAVPLLGAWLALRARSWWAFGWVATGSMVWGAALNWVFGNG